MLSRFISVATEEILGANELDIFDLEDGKVLENEAGYEIYSYDGFNRLTDAYVNGSNAKYTYMPNGLRSSKTVNGETTNHIWDGANIAAETDGNYNAISKYMRGINLISDGRSYYLYNAHGDVVQLADGRGNITKSYEYTAFGTEVKPDDRDTNPWRYCGEYWDLETNNYYLRARYYDPATSRMLSEDPHWRMQRLYEHNPQGLNLYVYCLNNPVMYVDPSGLDSYIFVNSANLKDAKTLAIQAEIQKLYGTPAHVMYISSKDGFVDAWNGMGTVNGKAVTIDALIVDIHGGTDGYSFMDKKGNWVTGDQGSFSISDISLLDPKTMQYFISLGCNTGRDDPSNPNSMFVEQLLLSQSGISSAIAPHGYSYGNTGTVTSGILWWRKTTTHSRIWVSQATFGSQYYDPNAQGYKVFQRNSTGGIDNRVIGVPEFVFDGIGTLINAATK